MCLLRGRAGAPSSPLNGSGLESESGLGLGPLRGRAGAPSSPLNGSLSGGEDGSEDGYDDRAGGRGLDPHQFCLEVKRAHARAPQALVPPRQLRHCSAPGVHPERREQDIRCCVATGMLEGLRHLESALRERAARVPPEPVRGFSLGAGAGSLALALGSGSFLGALAGARHALRLHTHSGRRHPPAHTDC